MNNNNNNNTNRSECIIMIAPIAPSVYIRSFI